MIDSLRLLIVRRVQKSLLERVLVRGRRLLMVKVVRRMCLRLVVAGVAVFAAPRVLVGGPVRGGREQLRERDVLTVGGPLEAH